MQPNVVTTGPASINPDTGKPYGMSFPVVSFKDFVNVQKALVESLGIRKLRAVVGAPRWAGFRLTSGPRAILRWWIASCR